MGWWISFSFFDGAKRLFHDRHINLKRGECRFRKVPDGETRPKAERSDEAGVERGLMYLLDTNILLELLLNQKKADEVERLLLETPPEMLSV
jgi:hypothetical protein